MVAFPRRLLNLPARLDKLEQRLDDLAILQAQTLAREVRSHGPYERLEEAEFKVFSQWGDDGIIQYLVHMTAAAEEAPAFVEFGADGYVEANTRFLLQNDNWTGLVMDGSRENVEPIRSSRLSWMYELDAVEAFVTRENIDELLVRHAPARDLGLLNIDIDGNDYWVWEAITSVTARVVVIEYNSLFGHERALVVPYRPDFRRGAAHFSHLYFGASLRALAELGRAKGYAFVGCNSAGNNAYFVRNDVVGRIPTPSVESGYRRSRFRESRDQSGRLNFLSGAERVAEISHLTALDLETAETVRLADVLSAPSQ